MPIDRPTAAELIDAVRTHLLDEVAPLLEGQPAFHLRVATNSLAIVERTMAEGDAMDRAELARLMELVGDEGDQTDLIELNQRLAEKIQAGDLGNRQQTLEHLRQTALDKVRLANPRYLIPRD